MGKTVTKLFNGENLQQRTKLNNCVYENKYPRGFSAPALGLNTCIWLLFSNIFSETAWPIKAKFRVEPSWEVGKKVYVNGTDHMTKMATMLIYFQKSSTELIVL